MTKLIFYKSFRLLSALVWIANGLFCKVLHFVPRHEQIVARILGPKYASLLTVAIGISEIGMAIWVMSGIRIRLNAILQIALIGIMNIIEFIFAADLLLWGKLNLVFAFGFMLLLYLNEFKLKPYISR